MITIPFYNTRNTYVDSVLQAHLAFLILTYSLNMQTKNIALDTLKLLFLQLGITIITVETVSLTTIKGRRHLFFHILFMQLASKIGLVGNFLV